MNFLDAAYEILRQTNTPLHYTEITNRAQAAKILDTKGQTPEATMGARLYIDTKRPESRFRRVNQNYFTLADAAPSGISHQISNINQETRDELHKRLLQMPPDKFEALIGELLRALGFDEEKIQVTSYGGDGGIDVRGVLNAGKITAVNAAVQVKRWKGNVQAPIVQALRGALVVHEQGIIITTSKFSKGAIDESQATGKTRISLVDGEKLLDLLMEHKIGVKMEQHTVYSLDSDWWQGVAGVATNTTTSNPSVSLVTKQVDPAVTYPLAIQANAHGQIMQAELLNPKGHVRYNNIEYKSPSGAGQVATGWKSCNGWSIWRYLHPATGEWRSINELRS